MAEYPALPLWTDAYLADTRHLSTIEHGAYLLLLMEAWRRPRCELPDDDRTLAKLAQVGPMEWLTLKPTILAFWRHDKRRKKLTQKRLSTERDFLVKQSDAQRKRALKRWKDKPNGHAGSMPDRYRNDAPTPTPTPIEKETAKAVSKKRKKARASRLPEDWKIPPEWVAEAVAEGLTHAAAMAEAERMKNWSLSHPNGARIDWRASWRNWFRKRLADRADLINRMKPDTRGDPEGQAFDQALERRMAEERAKQGK